MTSSQQQQIRLEAALRREYKHLSRELERVSSSREYSYEQIISQMDQMHQRQLQIIKELETCTGIAIWVKTEQELLEENKRIQFGYDAEEREITDKINELNDFIAMIRGAEQ